jgi:F-type H+-transporting ATPase subunit a
MDIGEKLTEVLSHHDLFYINMFGLKIPVSNTVVVTWIIMAVLVLIAFVLTRSFKTVPEGKQNVAEVVVSFINSFAESNLGHHGRLFAPYLGTVALFLVLSNIIGIFNIIPNWEQLYELTNIEFFRHLPQIEIKPPTSDINVPASIAVFSMLVVAIGGIIVKGPKNWLKSFLHPVPLILPFKVLDYFIRPTSLCLRLFGNILGAFIVMELVYMAFAPVLPSALSIYFDLFDGIIQAYVFVFLTSFYIAESIE